MIESVDKKIDSPETMLHPNLDVNTILSKAALPKPII